MKTKIKNLIVFIFILLSSIMIIGSIYYHKEYPKQDFDQLLFYISNGVEYTAPSVVNNVIFSCIIPVVILSIILVALTVKKTRRNTYLMLKIRKKKMKIQLYPVKIIANHRVKYTILVFIIAIIIFIFNFKIDQYIVNKIEPTYIYDEYYVNGENINITFPEQKRNLIMIVVESLENTVLSKANGGAWEYSIVPELEQIAIENTSFSNNEHIGGAYEVYGANFSAGGNVAITAGIPLKTIDILKDKNNYKGNGKFVAGAYTLGEILQKEGYNLEIMMGSDATFGGRKPYYLTNGNYKIFDVNYAIEHGKMKEEDKVWWGFEDDKLYKWSKEEITNLANQGKPFNYIMLTADTHFVDGYLSSNAENKFETQYENVYAYSSKSINEFVEWIKKQDFYENTTIVIVGDHLGMQVEFYESRTNKEYERTIYNAIINPIIEATNNKNRVFTSMDLYPTILASIGVKIEGERIGLGTNLYSNIPTLAEQLGFEYLNNEIKKNSKFYNEKIFGDDYFVMKNQDKD